MRLVIAMNRLAGLKEEFTKLNRDLLDLAERCISLREDFRHVYDAIGDTFMQRQPDTDRLNDLISKVDPSHIEAEAVRQLLDKINFKRAEEMAKQVAHNRGLKYEIEKEAEE